jgi:Dienelactone hydrolase family
MAKVPNDIDAILDGACPMVASFGGRDRMLKGPAARLNGALERRQIDHDVKEYPDAGHSFLDDCKGLIGVLGVVIGELQRQGRGRCARPHPGGLRAPSRLGRCAVPPSITYSVPVHSKPVPRIRGDVTGTPWRQRMTKEFILLSVFCVEVCSRRIESASLPGSEAGRI